jgi:hypothetical protein
MAYSKLPKPTPVKTTPVPRVKVPKVQDSFSTEVHQETRRLTGATPRLLSAYQEKPARFLPKVTLQSMAGRKR